MLLQLDLFGRPLPTFNIKGHEKVKTWPGVLLTILMFCTVITLSCLLGIRLYNGTNPIISEHTESGVLPRDFQYNFTQMAFGVYDSNFTSKDNFNFVEFRAVLVRSIQGVQQEKELAIHKCSEEDLEKFYPV